KPRPVILLPLRTFRLRVGPLPENNYPVVLRRASHDAARNCVGKTVTHARGAVCHQLRKLIHRVTLARHHDPVNVGCNLPDGDWLSAAVQAPLGLPDRLWF
ncbi:hypothetical protein, partial [Paraburkholderia nemoris]|uniref:hypothetical protein n=1 Tax=Paraburkholderia nemoris TaxID=2793076 RepID=UPI001B8A9015